MNTDKSNISSETSSRPVFPGRAVITAGMPYGNKELHFGHIGGVFIHADIFARFLRDRIGKDNVIFVSGTDGFGSPIVASYKELTEGGTFSGTLEDFVRGNNRKHQDTLDSYYIKLNLFGSSCFQPYVQVHQDMGAFIFNTLLSNGHLEKRSTLQFYDTEHETFLNGRQVLGRCPIYGCNSERAYADECSLGHQYEPCELINPISTLSGKPPVMREVTNWYIKMSEFSDELKSWIKDISGSEKWRQFAISSMAEFLEPPVIHVPQSQIDGLKEIRQALPCHKFQEEQGRSSQLIFDNLSDMNAALDILRKHAIRYRTGKTIVPFRLTGNLAWGLKAPDVDGLSGLTFWCWPESLWAPISFTASYLIQSGQSPDSWKSWWCSRESQVFQFIGEDNVFFYGLPESAMFMGMQSGNFSRNPGEGELQLPLLVPNKHLLFLDKKASSSGEVKPPMAKDLLAYYTPDQLRIHFSSLKLSQRNIGFRPKPLNPAARENEPDPVLKEGNLLSNAFNKAVRSCFYTVQKYYDGIIPAGEVSPEVRSISERTILEFEKAISLFEFHQLVIVIESLIHSMNHLWTQNKPFGETCPADVRRQTVIDSFHMMKTATILLHPIAPEGTEMVREYLNLGEEFWDWNRIFEPVYSYFKAPETHKLKFLEPKIDFFRKHPSQL